MLWSCLHPSYEYFYSILAKRHGLERQEKFSQAHVIIFGLGGLGSHIAVLLARAGVGMGSGQIHLVDFDKVDLTNVHRQNYDLRALGFYKTHALKEHLLRINPYIRIKITNEKVEETQMIELIRENTIICEAFDQAETKSKLVDVFFSHKQEGQCLFSGNGMAGFGDGNAITSKKINDFFYLIGDGVSDVAESGSLVSTRVSLCASAQAHCILQFLAGE